jgi:hypothetical protein
MGSSGRSTPNRQPAAVRAVTASAILMRLR